MLLPFVLVSLWQGGLSYTVLISIIGIAMAMEWVDIVTARWVRFFSGLLGVLIVLLAVLSAQGLAEAVTFLLLALLFTAGLSMLLGVKLSILSGGLLYVGLPVMSLMILRHAEMGVWVVIYLTFTVWVTDIMAMFAGKTIGGVKLAPVISPNKTWAGLLGGMAGAGLIGAALSIFISGTDYLTLGVLGCVFAVVAQLGDLFESWMKRRHNLKDSGDILPGHGGVLDRVDGIISVSVFALFLMLLRSPDSGLSAAGVLIW